jgi:hypothetical protein
MHRTCLFLVALLVTPAALPAADPPAGAFFDGKSLDTFEGLKPYWKVVDGSIVGSTEPDGLKFNTFLCSKKKYKDFELTFQVRLKDGRGNSGVQIRSELKDPKTFAVWGPQCDIGETYWASLFGEHFNPGGQHVMLQQAPADTVRRVLKPAGFNDYHIRCAGKHVTIALNGATTVDGDFPKMADEGIIAFQLHAGGPMEVTFRRVEFRELK